MLFIKKNNKFKIVIMLQKITTIVLAYSLFISCGTPNAPEDYSGGYSFISKTTTYGDANDVIVDGNYAYIAQGEGGLAIYNIVNPNNPILIFNSTDLDGYSTKIVKDNNMIYLAAGGSGFNMVNISDMNNIIEKNQDINGKLVNLHVMEDFLIASVSESGIKIANIANTATNNYIDQLGNTHPDGFVRGLTTSVDKSKMFVATGEIGLSLYDISFFDDGYGTYPLLSSINLPGYAESVVLDEVNQVAYVACGDKGLQVVDYSDTSNIKVIGSYDSAGYAKEIFFENGKVYITASGLQIYDVSSPSNPKIIGIVDTEYALGVTVDANYIYVADKEEGLIIIPKK